MRLRSFRLAFVLGVLALVFLAGCSRGGRTLPSPTRWVQDKP
jgi:hypothetical protein